MNRVSILQEYIPEYRKPFFEALRQLGWERGILIEVLAGDPNPDQAKRGDAATIEWAQHINQHEYRIFGRRLVRREIPSDVWNSDLVILEQARRNLDAYVLLLPVRRKARIALWGHGVDFVKHPTRLERAIHRALSRRARHLFVYTPRGGLELQKFGVSQERITCVRNSIDTRSLETDITDLSKEEIELARQEHGLQPHSTAFYLGALDASKNIPLLLSAAKIAARNLDGFRLVIAGNGPLLADVLRARDSGDGHIVYVGPVSGRSKALFLALADVIVTPGRVGLVAVDSIAARRPLITTTDADHAPEYDYLRDAHAVESAPGCAPDFAGAIVSLLRNPEGTATIVRELDRLAENLSVEAMAERFLAGIETVIR